MMHRDARVCATTAFLPFTSTSSPAILPSLAMDQPASKRRRTDSHSSSPVAVQSSVWYSDGNIILQTGHGTSESPFTRFRVYKGILADKSSVFKDMFVVAGGSEEDELVDGCPLVQLDDDKEELEHVLRALHMDPRYVLITIYTYTLP